MFGRTKTGSEKQFEAARIDAGLYAEISRTADINASLLPTALAGRSDQTLLDSLRNSVLASAVYGISSLNNLGTEEQRRAGTAVVSNLSDIGSSFMLQKTGLGPVFGVTGKLVDTQMVRNVVNEIGSAYKNSPLRQAYENAVLGLNKLETSLRSQGVSDESIAKTLWQTRRDIGVQYKDVTPEPLRDYIYEVNTKRYTDPLGPTFESLEKKYKFNYSEIIKASQRPNENVDKLLGGFKEWYLKKSGY